MEDITIENGMLVIRVPMETTRSNPYDEEYNDPMQNIIGLYEGEYNNGICYRIDMDYKGKSDQWSDYFFKLNGDKKEFEDLMTRLHVDYVEDVKSKFDPIDDEI